MVFTPGEFESFTRDVVDCYCVQTGSDETAEANSIARQALNLSGDPAVT
jgi:hypothetical protein